MAEIENKDKGLFWLWLGVAVFAVGVFSFYILEQTTFVRTVIVLLGFALGVFLAYQSEFGKKAAFFIQETKIELKKVFWPMRPEVIKMTITIIIGVVLIALFLWLIDSILLWLVQKFI